MKSMKTKSDLCFERKVWIRENEKECKFDWISQIMISCQRFLALIYWVQFFWKKLGKECRLLHYERKRISKKGKEERRGVGRLEVHLKLELLTHKPTFFISLRLEIFSEKKVKLKEMSLWFLWKLSISLIQYLSNELLGALFNNGATNLYNWFKQDLSLTILPRCRLLHIF